MRLHETIKSLGKFRAILVITLLAVAFSVVITYLITTWFGGGPGAIGLIAGAVIPAVIAPIFSAVMIDLIFKLDDARAELQRVSILDDLTGVYTRRHFLKVAAEEFLRAERYGHEFSIIYFDLDDFKLVNDRFGHQTGDRMLQAVSQICMRNRRAIDTFARLGGEEFAYLLPATNGQGASEVAERVKRLLSGEPICVNGDCYNITASIGVAVYSHQYDSLDEMLARVDQVMYTAKAQGKNRIVVV